MEEQHVTNVKDEAFMQKMIGMLEAFVKKAKLDLGLAKVMPM